MRTILGALALTAALLPAPAATAAAEPQAPSPGPPPVAPAVVTHDVAFTTGDGQRLGGRIFVPPGARGRLPGLLLIHGSGKGRPWRALETEAVEFARQGMVVLAPDKRAAGYSKTRRDFGQLADDALRAFAVLRARPEVDPAKAGVWGLSEGGWVAPIAAARSADVKFLITVGGPGFGALRTQAWNMVNKLDRAGIEGSVRSVLGRELYRLTSDAGLFPGDRADAAGTLRRVRQPVLAIWGDRDDQVPPAESAEVFRANVPGSLTVRFLGGGHTLWVSGRDKADALAPGYASTVGGWVRDVTAGRVPPSSAGAAPAQRSLSRDLPPSAWWEGWRAQLAAAALLVGVFAGYLVTGLRRRAVPSRAGRAFAVLGLVTVPGTLLGAFQMIGAANGRGIDLGPLLAGRPVVWVVLQVLALATVVAGVVLARRWKALPLRQRVLAAGGALFLPWALHWGLLLP
ncbi:alpha/beta hydrolase family protein [Bailinhaonella thermotolerans]|nr:prolyl oligopeptidase family serine peptidase [Bailinhaonella thermotolerans]